MADMTRDEAELRLRACGMSDEIERLAKAMHEEWLAVMAEQGWHSFRSCPHRAQEDASVGFAPCDRCRSGIVPWSEVPDPVQEVNRRGARAMLKELGFVDEKGEVYCPESEEMERVMRKLNPKRWAIITPLRELYLKSKRTAEEDKEFHRLLRELEKLSPADAEDEHQWRAQENLRRSMDEIIEMMRNRGPADPASPPAKVEEGVVPDVRAAVAALDGAVKRCPHGNSGDAEAPFYDRCYDCRWKADCSKLNALRALTGGTDGE